MDKVIKVQYILSYYRYTNVVKEVLRSPSPRFPVMLRTTGNQFIGHNLPDIIKNYNEFNE